jgi:pimeloyl-ACP methyl ester carboxylesterase
MGAAASSIGVVLVHGGYHGAWCWERLLPWLDAPSLAVDLPGRGIHPLDLDAVSIDLSADSVLSDTDAAGFDHVLLVGHSLAGATLPVIAGRLGHRVEHLVFVSCLVVPDGQSVLTMTPPGQREQFDRRLRTGPGETTELSPDHHHGLLGNDLDEEQWSYVRDRVGPDSMRFFTDPVTWGVHVPHQPRTYVRLLQDRAVPLEDQDEMIRRLGPGVTVHDVDAGHEVMITQPRPLAAIVNRILADARRSH